MIAIEPLTGRDLEAAGNDILTKLGYNCVGNLNQVRLLDIFPAAPLGEDDHLEFDYLVPDKTRCYVGEITSRKDPSKVKKKCRKMAQYVTILNANGLNKEIWRTLGVPEEKLNVFRQVRKLHPFMMLNKLESFDCDLGSERTPVFYRTDIIRLQDYAESVGSFGKRIFLQAFPRIHRAGSRPLVLNKHDHDLLICRGKTIVSGGDESLADIFTFDVSPYELMKFSVVYRNDALPDLSGGNHAYQRPLISEKLKIIREQLLRDPNFMFPNSILVVLDSGCAFDADEGTLTISDHDSAVTIIDGQHRLYSYAELGLQETLEAESKILVTAIKFDTNSHEDTVKFSARAFVEINSNQTRIDPTHIDSIAYDILGHTTPRAIAAKVLLELNSKKQGPFYGLFKASYTALGVIRPKTVLAALASMINQEKIIRCANAREGTKTATKGTGYKTLMNVSDFQSLSTDELVKKSIIMISKYGQLLKHIFREDWPNRKGTLNSSLGYSKMMAALVKLLRIFIDEGLNWIQVQQELENIKANVRNISGAGDGEICFRIDHPDLPKAETKQSEMVKFLRDNR